MFSQAQLSPFMVCTEQAAKANVLLGGTINVLGTFVTTFPNAFLFRGDIVETKL